MKRIVIGLFVIILLLSGIPVFADEFYEIQKYHVNMSVNEQNVYTIEEIIDVKFLQPRRGIFRIIPLDYYGYAHEISNLSVTDGQGNPYRFSTSESGKGYNIRIGNPSVFLEGDHRYIIRYQYDMGDDRNTKFDQVYFNLLGSDWDSNVPEFSFQVTMPKPFPEETLNVTYGRYGSTDKASWEVDGLLIKGEVRDLKPYESVTFRVDMEEGYFSNVTKPYNVQHFYWYFGSLGVLTLIAWLLRLKNAQHNRIVPTLSFYPPEGMNPAEVAYIFNEEALQVKDLSSIILYWASKGYLHIEEPEKGRELTFVNQNKDLSEMKAYERVLFHAFFGRGKDGRVTKSKLKHRFHTDLEAAVFDVRSEYRGEREILINSYQYLPSIVIALTLILSTIFIGIQFGKLSGIPTPFNFIITGVILIVLGFFTSFLAKGKRSITSKLRWGCLLPVLWSVIWMAGSWFFIFASRTASFRSLTNSFRIPQLSSWSMLVLTSVVLTGVLFYSLDRIKKYSPFAKEQLSTIYGFREFLEKAKTEEIEQMFETNPSYYYDMLPFVYVFGLTKIWDQHLKDLSLANPEWYESSGSFRGHVFYNNFDNNFRQAAAPQPSSSSGSSSGGSFGGGGFSGGGGGGGGGGSW